MPEHRRRRATPETLRNPFRPSGYGGVAAAAALPPLDDAMASPASRRLAATTTALVTRPAKVFQQAPGNSPGSARKGVIDSCDHELRCCRPAAVL